MSATEFNYVVNVDTSRVMGAMSEVRSQIGMAMVPPGGAVGQPGSIGTYVGGAFHGIGQMTQAMMRYPADNIIGSTFTDPAIAFTPHYGIPQGYTTPRMERVIEREGMEGAARLRPPGVSPALFFQEVQANRIEREAEARHQAFVATRATLVSGAGGLLAGSIVAPAGTSIGRALGGARFGAVGGVLGGLGAFMLGESIVSGAIQQHYADVERIGGVTRELGEIMGSGRGFTRVERYRMGQAVREAAGDLNMDVQAMGDIMAGARQMGMLPTATSPGKLRKQARDLAQTVDEAAQLLGTSLGRAMGVIRGMTGLGFGGREGVDQLISMAGAAGISPMAMYGVGMAGAGTARQIEMPGRAGFDLFTQGVLSAAKSGLSREELQYVGNVTGLGRQIATTQMRHTLSPLGDMQLMAMAGGGTLTADIFDTARAAIQQIGMGGDPIGNIIQFDVHKRELREKLGARGMQMMTRQAIMGHAKVYQMLSPNISDEEAFRHIAMNQYGMSSTAAMGMFRGTMGRGAGGGGGGDGGADLAEAHYNAFVGTTLRRYTSQFDRLGLQTLGSRIIERVEDAMGDSKTRGAMVGGALGWALGSGPGAVIGAGLGYAGGAVYDFVRHGGFSLGLDPRSQADRESFLRLGDLDKVEEKIRRRHGLMPFNRTMYSRLARGKVDIEHLQLDTSSVDPYGIAGGFIASQMMIAGISPVQGGPGTIRMGENFYRIQDAMNVGNIDKIMSQRAVNQRVVESGRDWIRGLQDTHSRKLREFANLWEQIRGMDPRRQKAINAKLNQWGRMATDLLNVGTLPAGLRMPEGSGIRTPERRRLLEIAAGIDIAGAYGRLQLGVRGMNIVGISALPQTREIRQRIFEGIVRAATPGAREALGGQYTGDSLAKQARNQAEAWAKQLMSDSPKNREFQRVLIRAAQSADPTKFKAEIAAAASRAGILRPSQFAEQLTTKGAEFLSSLKKDITSAHQLGGTLEEVLGVPSGVRGRVGGRGKISTRDSSQFQGAFNPIGFGQTESALSLIQRSLKQTAGMIDKLDRRISGMRHTPSSGKVH